ncbi:MAG: glycosyltransferase [Cyanosarcina radialis HA8281-LM2]|nr:glycosyltransferase [Cyanosarcina radialis HA8281-LM2]
MKIGYLIPEFPGQTHIWMWREISHMREWGAKIDIFSTRKPTPEVTARHEWANCAIEETFYLWPQNPWQLLSGVIWAMWRCPKGLWQVIVLCFSIKLDRRPVWRTTLPLALVATTLAREALKRDIQHFHSQTCSNSAILAMMVKRLVDIPFSLTLNANIEWWGGAMKQKFSEAEFTIAVAKWLLEQIRSDYPELSPERAVIGRHGVDTQKWYPLKDAFRSQPELFQAITVGRLHPCKGHDVLIGSIKLLADSNRQVMLTIVGAGPEEQNLKSLVRELELTDRVRFAGSVSEEEIMALMNRSDVFVLASHAEPLGVVYMEAMASGVATIGTNAGGVPEIITDGQDGLLVPPENEVALKQAIELLMDDSQFRLQLARNGRKTTVERFDSRFGAAVLYEKLYGFSPMAQMLAKN